LGLKFNGNGHCAGILKSFTIRSNYSLNDFGAYQRQALDKYDFGYQSNSAKFVK